GGLRTGRDHDAMDGRLATDHDRARGQAWIELALDRHEEAVQVDVDDLAHISVQESNLDDVFRAGHPASRRCSSLAYSTYARSSRLAIRAPRPEYSSTNLRLGTLDRKGPAEAGPSL